MSRIPLSGRVLALAVLSLAAALSPVADAAAETPAAGPPASTAAGAAPRTVVVGRAKLDWYLQPAAPAQRWALVESFRQATAAHLTGGEPQLTPRAEPQTLPGGRLELRLPAELIHTMFAGPDGRNYCSDSTVTAAAAAVTASAGGKGAPR